MRLEDNMMPVLTGLIFAVVVGTTAQNSGDLLKLFGSETQIQADDDVFFVRAGANSTLDVLANDLSDAALSGEDIQIVTAPSCGSVIPSTNGITYLNSDSCEGSVSFTYCLGAGESCEAADVTMNVRPAPVSVAKTHIPEAGGLVPLSASQTHASGAQIKSQVSSEKPATLSAFVVTMAPQEVEVPSNAAAINKYLISPNVADLSKAPSADPAQFASLESKEVPLSAALTARFLVDHSVAASIASGDLVIEPTVIEGETVLNDLKIELISSNTQG